MVILFVVVPRSAPVMASRGSAYMSRAASRRYSVVLWRMPRRVFERFLSSAGCSWDSVCSGAPAWGWLTC